MNKRALAVGILTAGMSAGLAATVISPAAAQGGPVGGSGNTYYVQAPGSNSGVAAATVIFGNDDDIVYGGNLGRLATQAEIDVSATDGIVAGSVVAADSESPLVRRGNVYFVPNGASGATQNAFVYGNPDDEVYLGDWDGDGVDTLAVRRGNLFLVKNNNTSSGIADASFRYGDAGDDILIGNFNRATGPAATTGGAPTVVAGNDTADSILVRRGNEFFVSNYAPGASATVTNAGVADYRFFFGDAGDKVLVGDWAVRANDAGTAAASSDGNDQLMIQRGNTFYQSSELYRAGARDGNPEVTNIFRFGNVGDTAFTANVGIGFPGSVTGDSLGVRR